MVNKKNPQIAQINTDYLPGNMDAPYVCIYLWFRYKKNENSYAIKLVNVTKLNYIREN